MSSKQEKVVQFINLASKLLDTDRQMKDIFAAVVKNGGNKAICKYFDQNGKIRSYKYTKMQENAYTFAAYISNKLADKEKNKPVILKVSNGPHWGEIFWAILMSGFKPLLMDAKTAKEGAQNLANQSKAVAIISDDLNDYDTTKITFDEIVEAKPSTFEPTWENEVIFCSSGTTGDVKLMVFNGENLCHQICASLDMPKETVDIIYPDSLGKVNILAMIPFHHIFGFVAVFLWYTFYGKTLCYTPSNAPSDLQNTCRKCGVTHIYSVPLFWDSLSQTLERKMALMDPKMQDKINKLLDYNTGKISKKEAGFSATNLFKGIVQKKLMGNKVRYCISGGGALSAKTSTIMNGVGYPLYNGFGMTEVGVTSVELSSDVKVRLKATIGRALHGVEYKIAGDDVTKGELLIKGPQIHIREIIGGVEKPTELDNGFFHSGDIAGMDEDGEFYIKGRIKEIIINATGENIFPDELEIFFKDLPHVNQKSVLGVAKAGSLDEDICLALELDNAVTAEEIAEIEKIVNDTKLPHDVKINKIYLAKGRLPLANNMKVKRYAIKKAIEQGTGEYVLINEKRETVSFEGFDQEELKDVFTKMRAIFSKILVLPLFKVSDDGHWINDLGGDSMSYVELIQTVQNDFDVTIPPEQYGKLTCVNDFVLSVATLLREKK